MVASKRTRDWTFLVLGFITSLSKCTCTIEAFTVIPPKITSRNLESISSSSTKLIASFLNQIPPSIQYAHTVSARRTSLFAASSEGEDDGISSMKVSELRKELAEYGISTKSFFEKSDFVQALRKARTGSKKKVATKTKPSKEKVKEKYSASSSTAGTQSREEKIATEVENISSTMKVGEMKKELISMGIPTRSFFEKSEFVKALAEARVAGKKSKGGNASTQQQDEEYDASYRDVVMQKYSSGTRLGGFGGPSGIIDVRLG